ncbi:hypothetical protein DMC30DRAFT_416295 [Rhodotorula diobovata]|uniref:Dolichyl-diphosphooligosaccharide-protein glycosyltransferase subunit OST5 n=1 Tax=Rhodotorula diobovata TaxID=5288 RepID=A0A5C5FYD4_9BASI|nr:hypothetical protein DMC30DRAFT_416295 [Rhodotorula diobovata]
MSTQYQALLAEHASLASFTPWVSRSALPALATQCLVAAFVLTFYFSTLRDQLAKEVGVAALASVAGGFGLVFAFCLVGANV